MRDVEYFSESWCVQLYLMLNIKHSRHDEFHSACNRRIWVIMCVKFFYPNIYMSNNFSMFVLILLTACIICFLLWGRVEGFGTYNPPIPTPQSNYAHVIQQITRDQEYKKHMELALNPIPTLHCPTLEDKTRCVGSGCNWYSTFCSSSYPAQL